MSLLPNDTTGTTFGPCPSGSTGTSNHFRVVVVVVVVVVVEAIPFVMSASHSSCVECVRTYNIFCPIQTTLWSVRNRHKTRCIHPNDTRGGCQACYVPLCLLFGLEEFCFCTTSFITRCSCSVSYKPGKLHAPMPLRGSTDVCVNFFTVSISFHSIPFNKPYFIIH